MQFIGVSVIQKVSGYLTISVQCICATNGKYTPLGIPFKRVNDRGFGSTFGFLLVCFFYLLFSVLLFFGGRFWF